MLLEFVKLNEVCFNSIINSIYQPFWDNLTILPLVLDDTVSVCRNVYRYLVNSLLHSFYLNARI